MLDHCSAVTNTLSANKEFVSVEHLHQPVVSALMIIFVFSIKTKHQQDRHVAHGEAVTVRPAMGRDGKSVCHAVRQCLSGLVDI